MTKTALRDRRRLLWMAAFAAFFGVNSFFRVSSKPRFETIHALDVVGLMTAGAGLAVVVMALVLFFIRGLRTEDSGQEKKSGEKPN